MSTGLLAEELQAERARTWAVLEECERLQTKLTLAVAWIEEQSPKAPLLKVLQEQYQPDLLSSLTKDKSDVET